MKSEFKRFNLEKFGLITIFSQLLGALGLMVGLIYNPILLISSGGLAVLMFLGVLVRIKIRDGIPATIPALIFMVLNLYIFIAAIILL